jgi:hypothetical protein
MTTRKAKATARARQGQRQGQGQGKGSDKGKANPASFSAFGSAIRFLEFVPFPVSISQIGQ